MKFKVLVVETLSRIVEVDECCKDRAIDAAQSKYEAEDIVLDAEDFEGVEFEVIER